MSPRSLCLVRAPQQGSRKLTGECSVFFFQAGAGSPGKPKTLSDDVDKPLGARRDDVYLPVLTLVIGQDLRYVGKESTANPVVEGCSGNVRELVHRVTPDQAKRSGLHTCHTLVRLASPGEMPLLEEGWDHVRDGEESLPPGFHGEQKHHRSREKGVVNINKDHTAAVCVWLPDRFVIHHCPQHKVELMAVTVTLMGKPGCHLCDDAKLVIDTVLERVPDVVLEQVSLEDNPLWSELYGELIPVVLIDGVEHSHWRVDEGEFEKALHARLGSLR